MIPSLIAMHIKELHRIEDVAELVNESTETLRRKFLRGEGIPLGKYIDFCKIVALAEQLILSDDPCYTCCYDVGLREDSGAKLFKKHTGMTMQQFREKYRPAFLASGANPLLPQEVLHIADALSIVQRYTLYREQISAARKKTDAKHSSNQVMSSPSRRQSLNKKNKHQQKRK